jgi:hypothetical protein
VCSSDLSLAEQLAEETTAALNALHRDPLHATAQARAVIADLQRMLREHRALLKHEFVQALRHQAHQVLNAAERRPLPAEDAPRRASGLRQWRLVDETQIEQDVEIGRVTETIRNGADHELRELMTYTAALVGDEEVVHDNNPFQPDMMARTLWQAAHALPVPHTSQLGLMRHAGAPLARLLRKFYAGACARLEAQGLEPALYRTIIVRSPANGAAAEAPAGPHVPAPEWTTPMPGSSPRPHAPSASMPLTAMPTGPAVMPAAVSGVVSDAISDAIRGAISAAMPRRTAFDDAPAPDEAPAGAPDDDGVQSLEDLNEMIAGLFEVITGDRRLDDDLQSLVARLQKPAVDHAWRDPAVLHDDGHPLWLLMDRMALQGPLHPPSHDPERAQMLRALHGLVDALTDAADADALRWARDRLLSYERTRFEQRRHANEAEMLSLQVLEDQAVAEGASSFASGALDVVHLDTVPGHLVEDAPATANGKPPSAEWLRQLRGGDWVRLFMRGRWAHAQLLWYGAHREYWLFADGASATTWAMRRRALEHLVQMHLLSPVKPRSLVRDAANRVLHQLGGPPTGA